MPCACKKNKIQKQEQVQIIGPDNKAEIKTLSLPIIQEETQSDYDFTPTVQPVDTCVYCAMKHIALANVFMEYDDQFSIAGELQLAGYHYNTADSIRSQLCKNYARTVYTEKQFVYQKLPQLLKTSLSLLSIDTTSKQTSPGHLQYDSLSSLVHVATAHSLMFTEVFYEELNKGYAVGELVLAAVNIQNRYRDTAKHIRDVWKIMQEIKQPNDQAYTDAQIAIMKVKAQLQPIVRKEYSITE